MGATCCVEAAPPPQEYLAHADFSPAHVEALRKAALVKNITRLNRIRGDAPGLGVREGRDVRPWRGRGGLSMEERQYLYARRKGTCVHCQRQMRWSWSKRDNGDCFTVDHIQARSTVEDPLSFEQVLRNCWGLDNMQAMCMDCNRRAGNRTYIGNQPKQVSRHASIAEHIATHGHV